MHCFRFAFCRVAGINLHTFLGMVGYCSKDIGLDHFRSILKGVTREDRMRGAELFLRMGASQPMKGRTELTPNNIYERAGVFKSKCGRQGDGFKLTLYKMLNSGKYYPSNLWVVNNSGAAPCGVACCETMVNICFVRIHKLRFV